MAPGAASQVGNPNAFYPINFYDTREGEMRDAANGCAVNGIMNAVEINVGNLGLWLAGSPPTRSYAFDTLFLNPANLPPGTPMFQDVVNLSYHQNFTPQ